MITHFYAKCKYILKIFQKCDKIIQVIIKTEVLDMASPIGSMRNVKIFVLYLLENINYPLDFVTINDIVMQTDYVMYLDFAEGFNEMVGFRSRHTGITEEMNTTSAAMAMKSISVKWGLMI